MRDELTPSPAYVLAVLAEATDRQARLGRNWYNDAHAVARSLDPDNVDRAAGVIAALSPMSSWARNVELAARLYDRGQLDSGCLTLNRVAANRIYGLIRGDGHRNEPEDWRNVLKGPKVRAFADTIASPESATMVVIDRHAVDIAVGRVTDDATRARLSRKGKAYERLADVYRDAAEAAGMPVSVVQAITWVVWREEYAAHSAARRREAGLE